MPMEVANYIDDLRSRIVMIHKFLRGDGEREVWKRVEERRSCGVILSRSSLRAFASGIGRNKGWMMTEQEQRQRHIDKMAQPALVH